MAHEDSNEMPDMATGSSSGNASSASEGTSGEGAATVRDVGGTDQVSNSGSTANRQLNTDSLQSQLQVLRDAYSLRLPERIARIEEISTALRADWKREDVDVLHRLTHSLTGSGATYGFAALSDAARCLEDYLQTWLHTQEIPSPAQWQDLEVRMVALREAAQSIVSPDSASPVTPERRDAADDPALAPAGETVVNVAPQIVGHIPERRNQERRSNERRTVALVTRAPDIPVRAAANQLYKADRENRLIFLVEDDESLAQDLALQLSYFGYAVRVFTRLEGIHEAVQDASPAAIIMDMTFPEGIRAGADAIASLQQNLETRLPVMFTSARGDIETRLQAVRAGGSAYFTKPIDVSVLIDKLDTLTTPAAPDPYRVLIIEDEATLAAYHALILQQAGMSTAVVTDPLQVWQPLNEFRPDLILMDVYMPSCSGLELATVIRQEEDYLSIPIVFFSAETDLNKQLAAMSRGGDDFLTKPITPEHLVASVSTRAQRSRVLRSFMVRDSLTGLLNHTTIKEQFAVEVARAMRQNLPLSFVMIDIDSFKKVNDTYGHTAGDRVIKSLSRLLQQRLRQTDIIGRYGGEEFAVVLPDTDTEAATKVIDEIRASFTRIRQHADDVEFSVSFSAGVASFPFIQAASRLAEAADKALYEAKQAGRNRVMVAHEQVEGSLTTDEKS